MPRRRWWTSIIDNWLMDASYIEMHDFETSDWRAVVGQVLGARGDPTVHHSYHIPHRRSLAILCGLLEETTETRTNEVPPSRHHSAEAQSLVCIGQGPQYLTSTKVIVLHSP